MLFLSIIDEYKVFLTNDCDQVFFCSQYMKKHIEGKRHKNFIYALELEKKLNDINKKDEI